MSRQRLVGGVDDDQDLPNANVVAFIVPGNGSFCAGTLIAPGVFVTAAHCFKGANKPTAEIGLGPSFSLANPPAERRVFVRDYWTMQDPFDPGAANDFALVALDLKGLTLKLGGASLAEAMDLAWGRLLSTNIRRPTFTQPNPFNTNPFGLAGYLQGTPVQRSVALSTGTLGLVSLTNSDGIWRGAHGMDGVHTEKGDSGGPLFVVQNDGGRDLIGTLVGRADNEEQWVDVQRSDVKAFIELHATDHDHDGHPNWLAQHPLPQGRTSRWYGETDYVGACQPQADKDCDHWYDANDNCPSTFNPDQSDTYDDRVGDACSPGSCDCDPSGDLDGDGLCGRPCPSLVRQFPDNCPTVWNVDQANCNLTSELARKATTPSSRVLGDACDPVPCPASNADLVTSTTETCDADFTKGCTRITVRGTIETYPLGSNRAVNGTTLTTTVPNVPTSARYCNDNPSNVPPIIECLADNNIRDSALTDASDVSGEKPEQPWHRVSVRAGPFALPTPPGTNWALNYNGARTGRDWAYAVDFQRWFPAPNQQLVAALPACDTSAPAGTTLPPGQAPLLCLAGSLWMHANTQAGITQATAGDTANGCHELGCVAGDFANNYFPHAPVEAVTFCYVPTLVGAMRLNVPSMSAFDPSANALLWAASPITRSFGHAKTATELLAPSSSGLVALGDDGRTLDVLGVSGPRCGPSKVSSNLASTFGAVAWANASDPMRAGVAGDVIATAIASDGSAVVDAVVELDGKLELAATTSPTHAPLTVSPTAGPASRISFQTFFSRAFGATFVVGGMDGSGALHDVWYAPLGAGWVQATPTDTTLGDVWSATFSHADRRLYILDHLVVGGAEWVRLVRVDPLARSGALVAKWPRTRFLQGYSLAVDQDGSLLVSATAQALGISVTARMDVASSWVTKVHVEPGVLQRAPMVDPSGYAFVVRDGQGALAVHRRRNLTGLGCTLASLAGMF